ncbi:MAG: Rieske 2Fe-2S domain-containing protein [Leptospiraceae bacterium]|nr:Rieske 2Fe-2S domain-containing protein [Leptospiraceae bacterium]MDW7975873.1 Rieske 2Fe-2S domain-containing protein [Leptospiraceae bacterium]
MESNLHQITFDSGFWFYIPEIKIHLKTKIPIFDNEDPLNFKAYTLELPFFENQTKEAFFYFYNHELLGFFNECSHIKVPMDLGDHRFFDQNGNLICRVHGATFCPKTGLVKRGPARKPLLKILLNFYQETNILVIRGFYHSS